MSSCAAGFAERLKVAGWVRIPGVLSASAAAKLGAIVEESACEAGANGERSIARIVERHPAFAALAANRDVLAILESAMGPLYHLIMSYGHVKLPRSAPHTCVHSDIAHLRGVVHRTSDLLYKCFYALSPMGPGDGALAVVSGSHRRSGTLRDGSGESLEYVAAGAGDLVIFNANLLHSSTANMSGRPRLTVWFGYAQNWMRVFPGHEIGERFLADVRRTGNPQLKKVFGLELPYSTRPIGGEGPQADTTMESTNMSLEIDRFLSKFDESKAVVMKEIREGFFLEDGSLRMNEDEMYDWIADRAIDEHKVIRELALVVQAAGHRIPPRFLRKLSEQMSDESEHFEILRDLLPGAKRERLEERMARLESEIGQDAQWQRIHEHLSNGDVFSAILDINIVHEGYSAAAIEVLQDLPVEPIAAAYRRIGADEAKHHESGREFIEWALAQRQQAAHASATLDSRATSGLSMNWSWPVADAPASVDARTAGGASMTWTWPIANPTSPLEPRTTSGAAMNWSWPIADIASPLEARTGAASSMAWSWPKAHERLS